MCLARLFLPPGIPPTVKKVTTILLYWPSVFVFNSVTSSNIYSGQVTGLGAVLHSTVCENTTHEVAERALDFTHKASTQMPTLLFILRVSPSKCYVLSLSFFSINCYSNTCFVTLVGLLEEYVG